MKRRRDGSASCSWWRRRLTWVMTATATVSLATADARSILRVGNGTMATIANVSTAGCGFMAWPRMAETHYAAVLSPQPSASVSVSASASASISTSACGRCARVWCDDARLCGRTSVKSTVVYVIDDQRTSRRRARADPSDLNLAPHVFQNLTGLTAGRVPIRWRFVDCPSFDNEELPLPLPVAATTTTTVPAVVDDVACGVCVHNDSSPYWLAVQPVNDTLGVASLRVDGVRAVRSTASPSFFFRVADRLGRFNLSQLELSITTRSRRRFKRVVRVRPGTCVVLRRSDEVTVPGNSGGIDAGSSPRPTRPGDGAGDDGENDDDDDDLDIDDELFDDTSDMNPTGIPDPNANGGSPQVSVAPVVVPSAPSTPRMPPLATIHPPPLPAATSPSEARPPIVPPSLSSVTPSFPPLLPPLLPPPAIQVVPSITPTAIDKEGGWPTQEPADDGVFGSGSGVRSRSPPQASTPADTSASPPPPSSSAPPTPTIGRTPVGQLSGSVLTSPVFVGVLLGTVGLVGAVVAYRAKASQRHRLALVPPVLTATAMVATSRAAYTSTQGASTPREEFAIL